MSFYNGVPITVVSGLQHMLTPIEATSWRRAADEAHAKTTAVSKTPR